MIFLKKKMHLNFSVCQLLIVQLELPLHLYRISCVSTCSLLDMYLDDRLIKLYHLERAIFGSMLVFFSHSLSLPLSLDGV